MPANNSGIKKGKMIEKLISWGPLKLLLCLLQKCPCVLTEHLLTHFTASVSAEKGSSFVLNKICKFPFLKSLLFTIPIEIKKVWVGI